MLHLELPATEAEDDEVVKTICADPEWEGHIESWLTAYSTYRKFGGNPWFIEPADFEMAVKKRMYALYTSKRKTLALKALRDTQLASCPMCGSLATGDLDHHLPREEFAEFSVMRANLVPACTHCNSSSKGTTYRGDDPERFIHPYFDAWAGEPLWRVEIQAPYEAATFAAIPLTDLAADRKPIVEFHLANVLGKQFIRSVTNLWSTYPQSLIIALKAYDNESVYEEVETDLKRAIATLGVNAWNCAFYRGVLANPDAIESIRNRIHDILAL
ncbi:hypothetical protein ELI16_14355 [Rhizobium ruizarguesonis]|uniref:hypothetical protein n=1 Tax=Rhizobium ruizarguesonis TaxID=2081791 RepID=UPI001030E4EB|nr:hypothetical protein [Rhizobium ruizarguesonis]TAW73035.1 hypothetical protein ELI16_14355 [Rhizobium ruizarguesonis]